LSEKSPQKRAGLIKANGNGMHWAHEGLNMKQKKIRHGWLKVLCTAWIIAGSAWANDNATNSGSVPAGLVQNQTSTEAPLESAASQKMYGVNSDSAKIIEPKPVSLMEVMMRIFGALLIVTAILFGGAWWFRKSRVFGLVSARASHLHVIETRSIGSRHALHVVEYGSKRFLIADSPAGTNYLTDLEKLNDASGESDETAEKLNPGGFAEKFKSLLERKG